MTPTIRLTTAACQKKPRPIHWLAINAENVPPIVAGSITRNKGYAGAKAGPATRATATGARKNAAVAPPIISSTACMISRRC